MFGKSLGIGHDSSEPVAARYLCTRVLQNERFRVDIPLGNDLCRTSVVYNVRWAPSKILVYETKY